MKIVVFSQLLFVWFKYNKPFQMYCSFNTLNEPFETILAIFRIDKLDPRFYILEPVCKTLLTSIQAVGCYHGHTHMFCCCHP